MKKTRFSEEQMVKSCARRTKRRWPRWQEARDQRGDDLRLAQAIGALEAVDVKRRGSLS